MPALLHEYLAVLVDIRMKDSIHVHAHEIGKIVIVAGGYRVDRLIRIGHGIEKCVKRALGKQHKGVAAGIAIGAAENGMLDDMRNTGIIGNGCAKADVKHLIFIVI